MATYSATWSAFNDGELSPLLDGRAELPQYMKSGKTVLNWIPTVQGPLIKRGGTSYINQTGVSTQKSLLVPFIRSRTEAYMVEFYDFAARFYFNGSLVEAVPPTPYTIATPYAVADLYNSEGEPLLSYAESVDQLYLAHPKYPPQVLSFFGATNWTIGPLQYFDGPWQDLNTDETNRMYITGGFTIGATIAITASQPTFAATDVGSLIRIRQQDFSQLKEWYPGQRTTGGNIAVGVLERSGTNTYKCKSVAPGTSPGAVDWVETGSSTLITTSGDQWDGPQDVVPNPATANHYYGRGVQWTYQDCGYGVAEITAFADSQHVTAVVKRQFPASLVGPANASWRWEMGAWSNTVGWPRLTTFWKQRLIFAGIDRVWMSVSGDFANFADLIFGQVVTDSALTAQVLSDQLNSINWMAPQKTLLIGTTGGEFVISPQSISDPFGPTNFQIDSYSNYGGRQITPIRVQTATMFVQQNGRSLRQFSYVFTSDAYQSIDLTPLSDHITESGIVGMAWAQNPYYMVWCVLANGNLVSFTYNPEQEVRAWARHNIAADGQVVNVAVVPNSTGRWDDVYLVILRTNDFLGSITQFYTIERIEQPYDNVPTNYPYNQFYVDCGLTLNNTINSTLLAGPGATVAGTTDVGFIAGSPVFQNTDVGRFIHYDFMTTGTDDAGNDIEIATTAVAQITEFLSTTQVLATIDVAFPNLMSVPIAANGWRMTVTEVVNGLLAWQGNTISLLLDGGASPDQVQPFSSTVTFSRPASVAQIGLRSPSVWQSFRPEGGDPTGSAIGKPRRPIQGSIRVVNSLGVEFGSNLASLQTIETRPAGWPDDTPPPIFSGNLPNDPTTRIIIAGSDWNTDGSLMIRCQQPLAATICAVSVTVDEESDN